MSHLLKRIATTATIGIVCALATIVAVAFWPSRRTPLATVNRPPIDHETTRARTAALLANPPPEIRPECRSTVLDHGRRTRDVYVLLHGLTNCPAQFRKFADLLFDRDANVLMLRLPYHGFADRMTPDHARLTAQNMLDSANEAIDLAQGYGERVVVIGLSVSGVSAAWLAQSRHDIDLAVVIAPFLAPNGVPSSTIAPLTNLLLRLPNAFIWWDGSQRENLVGSPVSYPRFATRSIGQTMDLGLDLFSRAKTSQPGARKILLVTSPTDTAISKPRERELATLWKDHATERIFPAGWNVPHDCIDPAQPGAQIDLVYPQLLAWMDAELR
jgi:pimeloyl-ACP methyl ester carboxylesterase